MVVGHDQPIAGEDMAEPKREWASLLIRSVATLRNILVAAQKHSNSDNDRCAKRGIHGAHRLTIQRERPFVAAVARHRPVRRILAGHPDMRLRMRVSRPSSGTSDMGIMRHRAPSRGHDD
jgi:hypothetical protein